MPRLIGLLLLLNLGVLIAGLALDRWGGQSRAPLGFNAEKIRLLDAPDVDPTDAREPAFAVATAATAAAATDSLSCLSWPRLDADALVAVETRLRQAGIGVADYDIRLGRDLGWWVYLPPLDDAEQRQARMAEIRQKGISDLAPVRSGAMVNAISLGVLPSLEKARAQAAMLSAKGVEGVRYAPRPGVGEARLLLSPRVATRALPALAEGWPAALVPARCEAGG